MEERLPTLIELIARTKEGKLPIDEVVFYYQDKHGEERFIHRDELKKEATLSHIYGDYQDRAFHIKTNTNGKII